jgi:hypothetical protein
LESAYRVDGAGEAGVGRHLDEDLAQFVDGEAGVASRAQVDVELGFAAPLAASMATVASSRSRSESPGRAGVHVAEGVFDDVAAEITERVHDGLVGGAVVLGEFVAAAGVAVRRRSREASPARSPAS